MGIAYAADDDGNIGEAILHHVEDANKIEIWPPNIYIPLPPKGSMELFGIDFTITKHLLIMWVACLVLVLVFRRAFKNPSAVPSGLGNAFEAIVVFLRDEVIVPAMGEDGKRYLPYLLSVFFFILTCNLLGLIPWSATATGNISVTAGLALISLFMVQLGGIREHGLMHHAKNLVPPGIPFWLLPVMIPVELLGQLTKPFALCIRLYANMTAGHLVILSFLALIFVMKSFVITPVAVGFALFINILEVFIAFLQAYIFTMLTSLFMGMAIHPEH
ncbi:ATP synthase F0 subunit A [Candidatus Entotheonella serta]|nr:ATP synthase F0 subunit A [Candidatus Entotheonella serta]